MENVDAPQRAAGVTVTVDCSSIDVAIKKANRLVELLQEASKIIDSLSFGARSET